MNYRNIILVVVIVAIVAIIGALEVTTPEQKTGPVEELAKTTAETSENKAGKYLQAKEIVNPSGFINVDSNFKLADEIGKNIVLVDFWTYSCINCQRTLPYLNAWHEKYADRGLTIVGIHTPEFEFEELTENVQAAVNKFGIEYPVVQDNDYSTWRAYGNRYWPRKYLIDIDGFIVYDHIGEGSYDETEEKIQELLKERNERLGQANDLELMPLTGELGETSQAASPETYFGALRNELLANGIPKQVGQQSLVTPEAITKNQLYLGGDWRITEEYAENLDAEATITFKFLAKNVYMVARADEPVQVEVLQDGQPIREITVQEDQLYDLISNEDVQEHTLELKIESPGLQAFTFTFG